MKQETTSPIGIGLNVASLNCVKLNIESCTDVPSEMTALWWLPLANLFQFAIENLKQSSDIQFLRIRFATNAYLNFEYRVE